MRYLTDFFAGVILLALIALPGVIGLGIAAVGGWDLAKGFVFPYMAVALIFIVTGIGNAIRETIHNV